MEIFVYLLLGIFLFMILKVLNKKFNLTLIDYIVFSLIYIIAISSFYKASANIFLVIIFEMLINIVYTTYVKEENFFKYNLIVRMYIILIFLAFIINKKLINTTNINLSGEDIGILIWALIIIFIYSFFKNNDIQFNAYKVNRTDSNLDNTEYIVMQYAKFRNLYKDIIKIDKSLINIVYAGMIYLNHERPLYLRKLDNFKFKIDNKKRCLGIMQIDSSKIITDYDSVLLAIKDIEKLSSKLKAKKIKKSEFNKELIKIYFKKYDYYKIIEIHNVINKF